MCNDGPRVRDKTRQKLDPNYPKPFTGEAYRFSAPNQETLPVFSKDLDDTVYLPETRPVPAPYTMTCFHMCRDTPGGQSVHTEASQSIPLQPQKNRDFQHSKSTKPGLSFDDLSENGRLISNGLTSAGHHQSP